MMSDRASLIILAGGDSRRMGRPKHLLPTSRGTILEHLAQRLSPLFGEILLVGRDPAGIPDEMRFVEDLRPERSPLVGVYSGLQAAENDVCFVTGCDMPFIVPQLVQLLLEHADGVDVVVPLIGGFYEPLFSIYHRTCVTAIECALDNGRLKVTSIYPELRIREIAEAAVRSIDPDLVSFINLNTPKQLSLLARL